MESLCLEDPIKSSLCHHAVIRFAAFKDLQVFFEEGAEEEVSLDIQHLWVVPKQATRDTYIEDVYQVVLEDKDESGEDEDLDQASAPCTVIGVPV